MCFGCGRYGHRKEVCPLMVKKTTEPLEGEGPATKNQTNLLSGRRAEQRDEEELFGPWMIVQKDHRRRRVGTRTQGHTNQVIQGNGRKEGMTEAGGSRFSVLGKGKNDEHNHFIINDMGVAQPMVVETITLPNPKIVGSKAGNKKMPNDMQGARGDSSTSPKPCHVTFNEHATHYVRSKKNQARNSSRVNPAIGGEKTANHVVVRGDSVSEKNLGNIQEGNMEGWVTQTKSVPMDTQQQNPATGHNGDISRRGNEKLEVGGGHNGPSTNPRNSDMTPYLGTVGHTSGEQCDNATMEIQDGDAVPIEIDPKMGPEED